MLPIRIAFDPQKPDPRDVTIQGYLDEGQWKSALAIVEQQAKKGTSQKVAINKCLIQLVSGELKHAFEGLRNIQQIMLSKDVPITNVEILEAVDYTMPVETYGPPDFLTNIWERAVAHAPKDAKLLDSWFDCSCRRADFVSGRKAAMKALKVFDNKHAHQWRAIACCYLDAQFGQDPQVAKLSAGMGVALLKQSLQATALQGEQNSTITSKQSNTPLVKNPTSPSIQNSLDLQLLLLHYGISNMDEAALAVLDSEKTGLKSIIGRGSWLLALEKLKLLKKLQRTKESWEFCYQLLNEATMTVSEQKETPEYYYGEMGDDLVVWRAATESVYQLKDIAIFDKFQELLKHPQLKKRHQLLATIDLSLMIEKDKSAFAKFKTTSTAALQTYLDHFINTDLAYGDLRVIAEKLTDKKRTDLLKQVQRTQAKRGDSKPRDEAEFRSWMHVELNELKLRYTVEISHPKNLDDTGRLERFAETCITLYNSSLETEKKFAITDRRTGDEAAILAASAFIHLRVNGQPTAQTSGEIQAVLILERLLENSKHHYGALMLLVRLYVRLGCFDLAHKHYQRLDLKNVQRYSEAWVLLDRIATIFPYYERKQNREAFLLLTASATYADAKEDSMRDVIERYEKLENWVGIANTFEVLSVGKASISRASALAELSRYYYRHRVGDCFGGYSPLQPLISLEHRNQKGEYYESRSTEGFPNYEALESKTLEEYVRSGSKTNQLWVEMEDLMFTWRRYTKMRVWNLKATAEEYLSAAAVHLNQNTVIHESWYNIESSPGLTRAERLIAWMITIMAAIEDISHALELNGARVAEGNAEDKANWILSQLVHYERIWKQWKLILPNAMDGMDRHSTNLYRDPARAFHVGEWEFLHVYYKLSELLLILPQFFLDRIDAAQKFNQYVQGADMPLDEFEVINVSTLQGELRQFMNSACQILVEFKLGSQEAVKQFKDGAKIKTMVNNIRGTGSINNHKLRKQLETLLEREWVEEKFRAINLGWQDSVEGIIGEAKYDWWVKQWPQAAVSFIDSKFKRL